MSLSQSSKAEYPTAEPNLTIDMESLRDRLDAVSNELVTAQRTLERLLADAEGQLQDEIETARKESKRLMESRERLLLEVAALERALVKDKGKGKAEIREGSKRT